MKNIFKLLLVSLIFTACEDVEPTIYNGSESDPTFLSFTRSVYTLPVVRDAEGTLTITLNSSTVSSVDRTYNLVIDEDASTAPAEIYDFPSTITIPAGSYSGTAVVTGEDINVTAVPQTVVFRITEVGAANMDVTEITVNIVEVCPLGDEFTGTYTLSLVGSGVGSPIIQTGATVQLVTESEFERSFSTGTFPEVNNALRTFNFTLSCEETFLSENIETSVYCTVDNLITLGAAEEGNAGTYNNDDDSVIVLNISEDTTGSCDGPFQTSIILTKVN